MRIIAVVIVLALRLWHAPHLASQIRAPRQGASQSTRRKSAQNSVIDSCNLTEDTGAKSGHRVSLADR